MIYNEQEARALVIEAGHRLLESKLIARTWGNISARISEQEFIITPSGRAYDTLLPEDLVKVRIQDLSYEGSRKPSSEKGIHAAAYALRPEVGFVIHTHQFYASALAAAMKTMPFAPCAGYGLPGTGKLKNAVRIALELFADQNSFLMARHGALCLGDTLEDAFQQASQLEIYAQSAFESKVGVLTAEGSSGFDTSLLGCPARFVTSPIAKAFSDKMKPLLPYIDDFAQIAGPSARLLRTSDTDPSTIILMVQKKLKGRNALVIPGCGILCIAADEDDLEAVCMIAEKTAAAALYAETEKPLSLPDAALQRFVYLKKYSKQKND